MKNAAKLLHLIGLVMFLGGILASIAMNVFVGASTDAMLIFHQRQFVSAISWTLTIPGMWLVVITGIVTALSGKYRLVEQRWLTVKLVLAVLILVNGAIIITPLVDQVTGLAGQGAMQGQLSPAYLQLKAKEDTYGIANFVMIWIAILLAIFRPGSRRGQPE